MPIKMNVFLKCELLGFVVIVVVCVVCVVVLWCAKCGDVEGPLHQGRGCVGAWLRRCGVQAGGCGVCVWVLGVGVGVDVTGFHV